MCSGRIASLHRVVLAMWVHFLCPGPRFDSPRLTETLRRGGCLCASAAPFGLIPLLLFSPRTNAKSFVIFYSLVSAYFTRCVVQPSNSGHQLLVPPA